MAIKGRTKRSHGRPARRVTPGPRPVTIERRDPWFRAPAFAVTVALVALLLTSYLAVERLQYGWQRDDVERFTDRVADPVQQLVALSSSGVGDTPGFTSASELTEGEIEPAELAERAELWQIQAQEVIQDLNGITLGERVPPGEALPANDVGGRVRELDAVLDAYVHAATLYEDAAATWSMAAQAPEPPAPQEGEQPPPTADLRTRLMDQAQQLADMGQGALDLAVTQLAGLRAGHDLPINQQLPGESSTSYSERGGGASQ